LLIEVFDPGHTARAHHSEPARSAYDRSHGR